MANVFPTTLNDFSSGDVIESAWADSIEDKLGIDNSAVATSIDYLLKSTSSSDPGHKHTLANGATDVTASATELNILDGATLSVTELNYVDGVTSAIQTQLDGKAATDQTMYIGTTAVTIDRASAALTLAGITLTTPDIGTPSAGTLTSCTGLPIAGLVASTSTAIGVGSIELGHATDTTITRVSAGVVAIEGINILTVAGGTLTGNIILGENTAIALDPAGSADGKYTGITVTGTAGAVLAFGDLVYLAVADSRWELADADAIATSGMMLGMCVLAAAGDGSATTILLNGIVRADTAFPALTIGSPVYAGETAGDIQVAVPTGTDGVVRIVGYALTADEIYFNPSPDHITIT